MTVEVGKTPTVTDQPVVIVVPLQLDTQRCQQLRQRLMAMLPTPLGDAGFRVAQFLPRRAPRQMRLPFTVLPPAKLEAQKVEAGRSGILVPVKSNDTRFLGLKCQPKFLEPLPKHRMEPERIVLPLKRTHEVVCVADQIRPASTAPLYYLLEPQIQHVV